MLWNGERSRCSSVARSSPRPGVTAAGVVQAPLPSCGGVVFFHLPKTGGSTIECFLGAQTQFGCCYRSTCGYCKSWKGGPGNDAPQCSHRGLLPLGRVSKRPGGIFVLPGDLIRALGNVSTSSGDYLALNSLRFVTALHMGPDAEIPTMTTAGDSSVLHFAFLRDVVWRRSCRLVLVTMLRHPVAQLLSAWHFRSSHASGGLATWAGRHNSMPLGMRNYLFRGGSVRPKHMVGGHFVAKYERYAQAAATASVAAAVDPILSLFDVVGHTERFDESLLLMIDAAGLQSALACPSPRNTRACHGGQQPSTSRPCYDGTNSSSDWAVVAKQVPELIRWYEARIALFDQAVASRGQSFASRVARLGQMRRARAAASHRREESAGWDT